MPVPWCDMVGGKRTTAGRQGPPILSGTSNIARAGGGGVCSSRWRKMALQWRVNSQECLGSRILHIISTTHRVSRRHRHRRRESYWQQQEKKGRRRGRGRSTGVALSSGHGCSWLESVLRSHSSVLRSIYKHTGQGS